MQQRYLGRTGMRVSSLGLGTLTWGRDTDETEATRMVKSFVEAGGNLIDTCPTYGDGRALGVLSQILRTTVQREELMLVSKGGFSYRDGEHANSRAAINATIDATLKQLGTDYLDVFLLQAWDPHTALEETIAALDAALRNGKVCAVGVSNHGAWDTAQILYCARQAGVQIALVENEYSLLQREAERDLQTAVEREQLGFVAWSALARGVLTGKYRHSTPPDSRAASPLLSDFVSPYLTAPYAPMVEAVVTAAQGMGVSPQAVALAWVLRQPFVTSALVGPRTDTQLEQILDGADFPLPDPLWEALADVTCATINRVDS